jgi:tyrosyl-tRNA synthetase
MTTPLVTLASGAKMGKTAEGAVWLNEERLSSYDYWQFWRNTDDADVGRFLRFFTELPLDEIARLEALQGAELNEAKKILANEATRLCHGEAAADEAAETARRTFEEGTSGDALPVADIARDRLANGLLLYEALRETGLAATNGEARRLIKGGGARVNDQVIDDEFHKLSADDLAGGDGIKLSAGKKRHAMLRLERAAFNGSR